MHPGKLKKKKKERKPIEWEGAGKRLRGTQRAGSDNWECLHTQNKQTNEQENTV